MAIKSAVIDTREPQWVQRLTFGGVPVITSQLEAGDVWVATVDNALLVVERKTVDDLLNTIRDRRLGPQVARMKAISDWSYLMITGEMTNYNGKVMTDRRATGWAWNAIQGALLTVQELGVMVIHISGDNDYEKAIIRLAKRSRDAVTIRPPRVPSILSEGEAAIAALPGIGIERLSALLDYTRTPAWALTYLTDLSPDDGIDKVPGIGHVTRLRVRRALRLKDNEQLSVIVREETDDRNDRD